MFGCHCWYTSSTTQTPLALSAGESETYGLTKACARSLGTRQLALDLGFARHGALGLQISTDSTTAIGVASRRGSGKIRHIETGCLWIQSALLAGRFKLLKVLGKLNPGDLMTKGLSSADIVGHLKRLYMYYGASRSTALPESSFVQRRKGAVVSVPTS